MTQRFCALLLIATVVAPFITAMNSTDLRWSSFEEFSNSQWTIHEYDGQTTSYRKPSDLDPRLVGLDSNFTGTVWGAGGNDSIFTCEYFFYSSSLDEPCTKSNITLHIKYYLELANNRSDLAVWPAEGQEKLWYLLPASPAVQWNELSIRLDVTYLGCPYHHVIDVLQVLGSGDILLFDEISITYTENYKRPEDRYGMRQAD